MAGERIPGVPELSDVVRSVIALTEENLGRRLTAAESDFIRAAILAADQPGAAPATKH